MNKSQPTHSGWDLFSLLPSNHTIALFPAISLDGKINIGNEQDISYII